MDRETLVEQLTSDSRAGKFLMFRVPKSGGLCLAIEHTMLTSSVGAWRGMAMAEPERARLLGRLLDAIEFNTEAFRTMRLTSSQSEDFADKCALWFAHELLYGENATSHLVTADAKNTAYVTH